MDAKITLAERKLALISEICLLEDSNLVDQLLGLLNTGKQTESDEISPEDWASIQRGIAARDAGEVISPEEARKRLASL